MEPLRPGTEPTLKEIVACIENFQIDKFPEFLGQLSCPKGNASTRLSAQHYPLRPGSTTRTLSAPENPQPCASSVCSITHAAIDAGIDPDAFTISFTAVLLGAQTRMPGVTRPRSRAAARGTFLLCSYN